VGLLRLPLRRRGSAAKCLEANILRGVRGYVSANLGVVHYFIDATSARHAEATGRRNPPYVVTPNYGQRNLVSTFTPLFEDQSALVRSLVQKTALTASDDEAHHVYLRDMVTVRIVKNDRRSGA